MFEGLKREAADGLCRLMSFPGSELVASTKPNPVIICKGKRQLQNFQIIIHVLGFVQ